MKKAAIIKEYEDKCGDFKVEQDEADGKTYIYTERFYAQSLLSKEPLESVRSPFLTQRSPLKSYLK